MIAIGIAFVIPVFMTLLNFLGILSAKAIIRNWRIAVIVILMFTAIATPAADIVSMVLLAVPMVVLYFASWLIALVHDRRVSKKQAVVDAEIAAL